MKPSKHSPNFPPFVAGSRHNLRRFFLSFPFQANIMS